MQVINIEVKQLHSITEFASTVLHAKQTNLQAKKVDKMIRYNSTTIILTILILYGLTNFFLQVNKRPMQYLLGFKNQIRPAGSTRNQTLNQSGKNGQNWWFKL